MEVSQSDARSVLYSNTIRSADPTFTSPAFTSVSGQGNSLRYWFKNTGTDTCTVTLYKKTVLGLASTGSSFTVAAGANKYAVYSNPGDKTFVIKIPSQTGAAISGTLRANQLNL